MEDVISLTTIITPRDLLKTSLKLREFMSDGSCWMGRLGCLKTGGICFLIMNHEIVIESRAERTFQDLSSHKTRVNPHVFSPQTSLEVQRCLVRVVLDESPEKEGDPPDPKTGRAALNR